jgi:hypothetical protein
MYTHQTNKRLSQYPRLRGIVQTGVNFIFDGTRADARWFSENFAWGFTAAAPEAPAANENNYVVQRP